MRCDTRHCRAMVNSAKEPFPEIHVVLGMEYEYTPEFHSFFEDDLLGKYDFEYLIGAPHFSRTTTTFGKRHRVEL